MSLELDRIAHQLEYELAAIGQQEGGVGRITRPEYDVIGPTDDRFPITARRRRPSTLLFPTNTICFLEMTDRSGSRFTGTGTLIAPQVVLTAKHNLIEESPSRCASASIAATLMQAVAVTPGADLSQPRSSLAMPFGRQTATAANLRVDASLDFGVILLPAPVPRLSRFMRLQARGDTNTATLLTIAGYPCDKPQGTMWGHSSRIPLTGVTATHLHYSIDTCPGHSGSPIWLLGNDGIRLLLGVHTNGVIGGNRCGNASARTCRRGMPPTPVSGTNCGVRVTPHVINTILGWCRAAGVRGPIIDRGGLMRGTASH